MANEISLSATLASVKNGASLTASASSTADQSGANSIENVQAVGTSAEAITLGDTGTPQFLFLKNLDETNYVEVDSANTFDKFPQKLAAGKFVLLAPQTATIYLKANTAPCNVLVLAVPA